MPRKKAQAEQTIRLDAPWVGDAQELARTVASYASRVEALERSVRALRSIALGNRLPACSQCHRAAERRAVMENPRSGTKHQDLCGQCAPKHPALARAESVTYVELAQAKQARDFNAALEEP